MGHILFSILIGIIILIAITLVVGVGFILLAFPVFLATHYQSELFNWLYLLHMSLLCYTIGSEFGKG